MKATLVGILLLLSCSTHLFSQSTIIEADFGTAMPMHSDLKTIFDIGVIANAGVGFRIINDNFYVKPSAGVQWYFKTLDNESVKEHFRTWKGGLEVRYYVLNKRPWQLAPFIKADYNWSRNYFSDSYTDPVSHHTTNSTSDVYLKGEGVSYAVGAIMAWHGVFLKANYELYTPTLTVNQEIIDSAYEQGIIVDPTPSFNLSSLNLSIGYTYKINP